MKIKIFQNDTAITVNETQMFASLLTETFISIPSEK